MRRFTRDKFIRYRFALQTQVLRLRDRRDVDIKQWEQQFADSPGFLKVRVAGEDKTVDAKFSVFIDSFGNGGGIAHQRSTGAAARSAAAGPQVGADLALIASSVVQRRHAMLANRIGLREGGLRAGDGLVIQMGD